MTTVLRNVRPWGEPAVDVTITDGHVSAVGPVGTGTGEVYDGRGLILLPSFADVHVHLDSTRWGLPFRSHDAGPSLIEHIESDRAGWSQDLPMADKATAMLGRMISRGTTKVRSYAQIDSHAGLARLEGVRDAAARFAGEADVTIMGFPQSGIMIDPPSADLLETAAAEDLIDVVGGIDPCTLDRDPKGHLDVVFGIAEKYGLPVDLHIHETGTVGAFSWELVFERVRALGMQGRVTISHAMALASNEPAVVERLLAELAELDVALATVSPRGRLQLPYRDIMAAGIRLGLGQDGQRDYWSPYGDGDLWSRLFQLAWSQNLKTDAELRLAAYTATLGGRQVIDAAAVRPDPLSGTPGVGVGEEADFVLVAGETLAAAVVDHLPERVVVRAGRVLADSRCDDRSGLTPP